MYRTLSALPFILAVTITTVSAQTRAAALVVTIDPARDTAAISPYIYGSNGQSDDRDENITTRRQGGNRMTGYNWENNASNAGSDYLHQSDDYLTYQLSAGIRDQVGVTLTAFHDVSIETGCYSLLTLPAAGYVARDKKGPVAENEAAPSSRWVQVKPSKGSPFALTPDTTDGAVYADEEVNFLVNRYGGARTARGVRGYAVDNEPALWPSTHPRIHKAHPTIDEMVQKTTALARAVKSVDPDAEIFGAVAYGFAEYQNFQDAPDWNANKSYGTYLDALLARMKAASEAEGRRLIDVLDLHWYPEAQGESASGWRRITLSDNSEPGVAAARMQAPRTLWDSTYREHSWIGDYFSPVALLPKLRATIAARYPGTKLAFTEINYGGDDDISGGIAMADVLGLFGRYGVYMSNYWGELKGYVSAAYRIYRNYDGARSTFGARGVYARTDDAARGSAYAAVDSAGRLHVIAINKDAGGPLDAEITIDGGTAYTRGAVYGFTASDSTIRRLDTIGAIAGNRLTYTLPRLSVVHLILEPRRASGVERPAVEAGVALEGPRPNPVRDRAQIAYRLAAPAAVRLVLFDADGREAATLDEGTRGPGNHTIEIRAAALPSGVYQCRLVAGDAAIVRRVVIAK